MLRGGIIGAIFILVVWFLTLVFPVGSVINLTAAYILMIPGMFLLYIDYSLWFHGLILIRIASILFWILLFALIYGKIKKSNSKL